MRDDVYKNIMKILRSVPQDSIPHSRRCMEVLQKAYPMIPELTLESIYTLYYQRRMRIRHFKCKELAEELYHRYNSAVTKGESRILLNMSLKCDLAPALLARLILDQHFMNEDNKFSKCKPAIYVKSCRRLPNKLCSVSEESSESCERQKSSDNTVSEVSEDLSVEECNKEFKMSDDVLPPDTRPTSNSEEHRDSKTIRTECENRIISAQQNGKLSQEDERVQVSGSINDCAAHLKSGEICTNERLDANNISSLPNGYTSSSKNSINVTSEVTICKDVSSSKVCSQSDSQILQEMSLVNQKTKYKSTKEDELYCQEKFLNESVQSTELCKNQIPVSSKAITTVKQESCDSKTIDTSQMMEGSFRDELQELKNKLIQLKLETKMLETDRPTASGEAGIEFPGLKRSISRLMKDTTLIKDKILAHEISMCVLYDDQYGPAATTYKHSLGQEYEVKLIKHAKAADLTFHLEARLRERGFDKTPDLLLIYPIAIGCNVVNWIESKALFADREVHSMYFVHQYERYCSRYGPGLVIYWFGFVESLREDDPFILVRDNFPKYIKHMNLLVDDASDGEADEENSTLPDSEIAEPSAEEMTKFLERFSS